MVSEQVAGRKSLASTVEEVTITYNMIVALALDRGHTDGWPRMSQLRAYRQEFLDWVEASGAALESSLPGSLSYQYYDRPDIYSKFTEGATDLCEILKRKLYRAGVGNPDRLKETLALMDQCSKTVTTLRELTERGKSPPWEA
ncbi:hypothetical protein NW755_002490 [Fusarium falciforme]|uniref:Uncharacterized protein n=1 Tax=Fusarium falciforme TaxID=195108 RepID=A0A9W8RFN4_9HYPO|nr:hypothetical protein NW755_002490 [Fusarium falciforme]